ncbi:MAG: HD domain-containing protein [Armatimonadetes bacterium]|nr:HD domain-containing protein [Armatimonadota bacterium]
MTEDPVSCVLAAWRREPISSAVEQVLRDADCRAWLVGGAVRDALLGRPVRDWDLLCDNPTALAAELAGRTGSRLVPLYETPVTYRLVLVPGTGAARYLDLVAFRAATVERDLAERDFTINAMAVGLPDGPWLDPAGGLADLRSRVLRAVTPVSLPADPVRCLRTYRFHSELGFTIAGETRRQLRKLAGRLQEAAGERIGQELLKLLRPPRVSETLRLMEEDGALWAILPEMAATRGVLQGGYHHLDVWGHTLEVVGQMERLLTTGSRALHRSAEAVAHYLSVTERWPMLLLAALLHDVSKPGCRLVDAEGHVRFLGHETEGSRVALGICRRLALGSELGETLGRLIRLHLRPLLLANTALPAGQRLAENISMAALRRLFRHAGRDAVGLVLLAIADAHGCRGPAVRPGYQEAITAVLDDMLARYLAWEAESSAEPLLRGADLIAAGYQPSPAFGRALRAVEEARVEGWVSTRAEALELARRYLQHGGGATRLSESSAQPE